MRCAQQAANLLAQAGVCRATVIQRQCHEMRAVNGSIADLYYSFLVFAMQARTASITALRIPSFSSTFTPSMVVPPGEHTISFKASRMKTGLQDHFGTSENCLSGKFISLFPGHSFRYGPVCQCFYKHENKSRRTSADSPYDVKDRFRDYGCFSERTKECKDLADFFFCHQIVRAYAGDPFSYQGRGVRHGPDDLLILTEFFFQPCQSFSGSDRYQDLSLFPALADLSGYFLAELRLYSQKR